MMANTKDGNMYHQKPLSEQTLQTHEKYLLYASSIHNKLMVNKQQSSIRIVLRFEKPVF